MYKAAYQRCIAIVTCNSMKPYLVEFNNFRIYIYISLVLAIYAHVYYNFPAAWLAK